MNDLSKLLEDLCPLLGPEKAAAYAPHLAAALEEFEIDRNTARVAAFLAQIAHESAGLTALEENLNYSAGALTRTWPKRFPPEVAVRYARLSQRIANRAYGCRMGNGDEDTGDGWRYRGRGAIQLTGRENYRAFGKLLGVDLEADPDLAKDPAVLFRLAAAFWRDRGCNELADAGDFEGITRRINGGLNGLEDRRHYHAAALALLDATEEGDGDRVA